MKMGGVRLDYQLSPAMRLMGKGSAGTLLRAVRRRHQQQPSGGHRTPTREHNNEDLGQFTQVLSNRALNEVKVGYAVLQFANANLTHVVEPLAGRPTASPPDRPRITFTGFTITRQPVSARGYRDQDVWSVRDDFTFSYDAARPSRPERRRRVPATAIRFRQLPAVHGRDRRARRPACRGATSAGALPGCVQRRHLEPRGDLAAHADLRHRRRRLRRAPCHSQKFGAWVQDDWQVIETG